MKRIIGLVGFPGSGKGTVCRIVEEMWQLPVVRTGDIVRGELRQRGLALSHRSLTQVSDEFRRANGGRFMEVARAAAVEAFQSRNVILVDALREPTDLDVLAEWCDELFIVAVAADSVIRHGRLRTRRRFGDPLSEEGMDELDSRMIQLGIDKVMNSADVTIVNNTTIDALRASTLMLMASRGQMGRQGDHREPGRSNPLG